MVRLPTSNFQPPASSLQPPTSSSWHVNDDDDDDDVDDVDHLSLKLLPGNIFRQHTRTLYRDLWRYCFDSRHHGSRNWW
jgi:hypothetical protein